MDDAATIMTLDNGSAISGYCAPGFEPVRDYFVDNFVSRAEQGAALCVTHEGQVKVDLWGGIANRKTQAPWHKDTICVVYSCTKGAAALCLLRLIEQGKIGLYDLVGDIWPGFAQHGKEATRVIHLLAHTGPVPHVSSPIRPGGMEDFAYMVAQIEAQPAFWEPGTRQAYQGLTYAWTVGNLVRLVAGKPLGHYFAEEFAQKWGLDFHIGLPETEEPRVARITAPSLAEIDPAAKFTQASMAGGSLSNLFITNTGGADFNTRGLHAAEIASANGITHARGLAGLYMPLANGGGGYFSADSIAFMSRACAVTHEDAVLMQPLRFGPGFMLSTDNRGFAGDSVIMGDSAFGHAGMGGSMGFADPVARLSFGYVMNRMGPGILLNARGQGLIDATYKVLGFDVTARGAYRA